MENRVFFMVVAELSTWSSTLPLAFPKPKQNVQDPWGLLSWCSAKYDPLLRWKSELFVVADDIITAPAENDVDDCEEDDQDNDDKDDEQ